MASELCVKCFFDVVQVEAKPEIANCDRTIVPNEYVLRLQITMNDVGFMSDSHCIAISR